MTTNKVVHIDLMGGLIGMLFTRPRHALDSRIKRENTDGWRAVYILKHSDSNLFSMLLKLVVLVCTIGLFTWGAGYMILFARDDGEATE